MRYLRALLISALSDFKPWYYSILRSETGETQGNSWGIEDKETSANVRNKAKCQQAFGLEQVNFCCRLLEISIFRGEYPEQGPKGPGHGQRFMPH